MSSYVKIEIDIAGMSQRMAATASLTRALATPITHSLSPQMTHGEMHEFVESAILIGIEVGLAIVSRYPAAGRELLADLEKIVSSVDDLPERRERRDGWVDDIITSSQMMQN